jgi:hypothetical protein
MEVGKVGADFLSEPARGVFTNKRVQSNVVTNYRGLVEGMQISVKIDTNGCAEFPVPEHGVEVWIPS